MIRFLLIAVVTVLLACTGCAAHTQEGHPRLYHDTVSQEAAALALRLLGDRAQAFRFETIESDQGQDVFELESDAAMIVVRGNNGVSMASGLHWYLKHQCHCQISINYNQMSLPKKLPPIMEKVRITTPFARRNFFNYCTFGYTMVWWDWDRWEKMIDYMALHGVNMPLAITGQEAVWQAVYQDIGLSQEQIADFLVGPAYLPWGWMGNIDGLGGPLPQAWIDTQKALQQKILARERALGMTPVLQAFTGHVPKAINEKYPHAKILQTTDWAGMPGTYFLDPMDPLFQVIGKSFIQKQTEMYGTDHLYDADCFNEVNPPNHDTEFISNVGRSVYSSMAAADPEAIWVFQGWFLFWQQNFWQKPQASALLDAAPHDRMIGLDLYCERNPVWDKTEAFYGKPWVWNVICNLGQKVNLSGDLQIMEDNLQKAMTSPDAGDLIGLGVMMEGFGYNPVVQEFILSKTWSSDPIDVTQWIQDYAVRRYGMDDPKVKEAWKLLFEGPYSRNILRESNICYTPSLSGKPSKKSNSPNNDQYDPYKTILALKLLLACSDQLEQVPTYSFDIVHLTREVLSNHAVDLTNRMNEAYAAKDASALRTAGNDFLTLIKDMDAICATNEHFMLGKWISNATKRAGSDAEKALYELNARAILTLWQPSTKSSLRDYASKQWSGLLGNFYHTRWARYLSGVVESLKQNKTFDARSFVDQIKDFELAWIHQSNPYPDAPQGNTLSLAKRLFDKYTLPDKVDAAVAAEHISIVPWPQSVQFQDQVTEVSLNVFIDHDLLEPLSRVLKQNITRIAGLPCKTVSNRPRSGIVFENVTDIKPAAYSLIVKDHRVLLRASSYEGFVHATASLLQIATPSDKGLVLPCVDIQDAPDYPFRSVLLDLARFWQPVHTIKETIDLAYLYKFNHVHFHLSDDQSFTFPSQAFPQLKSYFRDGTRRHYTLEELKDIVEYARVRGIIVIPEVDVPSHAGCLTRQMPEYFGTTDPETGKATRTGIVNMANERAYEALDTLFGEISEVFTTSPYLHIGADEVAPGYLTRLPEYMPYVQKHGLTEAEKGRTGELYAHFVVRMNEIIKKHGKKTMAWEGFHGTGTKNARIPTDIVVMAWNMGFNPPQELLDNGYTIINCAWKPLYIVPPQNYMDSQAFTYAWDIHEFQHRRTDIPYSRVPVGSDILGAQICYWEQTYEAVFPSLRRHIPVVSERIWNANADRTLDNFQQRFRHTDQRVEKTMRPISIHVDGLLPDTRQTVSFDKSLQITLDNHVTGVIRYRLDEDWGHFPDGNNPVYSGPFAISQSQVVCAGLFDNNNQLIAPYTQQAYTKIEPAYTYRVLGPVPRGGWSRMPDFSTLKETRTGVLGVADAARMAALNRVVFAKNPVHGHIDTQPYQQFNPFALEMTGQIRIPDTGDYTFKVKSPFGMARIYLGDTCVGQCRKPGNQGEVTAGHLQAGVYALRIEYFYAMIQNQLNIQVKANQATEFKAFEQFVLPMSQWKAPPELAHIPREVVFSDPARQQYINLATDKPVTCSGGTQNPNYPENAVDADTSNRSGWHSAPGPQWLQVDLKKVYAIDCVKLVTYYDGRRYYRYVLAVSTDGINYTEVADQRRNTTPSSQEGFEHRFDPVKARYVRVTMLSNSANPGVHINELMVFEKTD